MCIRACVRVRVCPFNTVVTLNGSEMDDQGLIPAGANGLSSPLPCQFWRSLRLIQKLPAEFSSEAKRLHLKPTSNIAGVRPSNASNTDYASRFLYYMMIR
jgi:hypothetical protein